MTILPVWDLQTITCTVHCALCTVHYILPFPPLSHSQAVKLRDRSLALNGLQSAHYMSHLVSPHNALLFITRQEQKERRGVGSWGGGWWQEDGMHMWGGLERVSACKEDTSPQGERWGGGGETRTKTWQEIRRQRDETFKAGEDFLKERTSPPARI